MDREKVRKLGAWGSGLLAAGSLPIPCLFALLILIGIIVLERAIKLVSDSFPEKKIYTKFVSGFGLILLGGLVAILVPQFSSGLSKIAMLLGDLIALAGAYLFKETFLNISDVLNHPPLRTWGNIFFYLILLRFLISLSLLLPIPLIAIGVFLMSSLISLIAWAGIAYAFYTLPAEESSSP